MARRKKHEEHQNHEAWAIPYGDLVTLLLAFFVVMYAISQVNAGKYRVLSDSMVAAFRGSPRVLEPVQVGEQQGGQLSDLRVTAAPPLPLRTDPRRIAPGSPTDPNAERVESIQPVPLPTLGAEAVPNAASASMSRVADAVAAAMQDLVATHAVEVRRHDLWVEVELRTDILFPSGAAVLAPGASGVIEKLADALQPFPNPIRVEGYTDNRPINTPQFPSNWELSAARAATVVQVLARRGVEPTRLSVLGLGEFRPVASNASPEGRNANRRVLLVIESSAGDPAVAPAPAPAPTTTTVPAPTPVAAPQAVTVPAPAMPAANAGGGSNRAAPTHPGGAPNPPDAPQPEDSH